MIVGGIDFSLIGYKIALLGFAKGLFAAASRAASPVGYGETHPLDLDEHLRFHRHGDEVTFEADFADQIAQCPVHELVTATRENCLAILRFFLEIHAEARESSQLFTWFQIEGLGADELFAEVAKSRQ